VATSEPERLHVFYDGFNLYYALRRKGWHRYLWLDYSALARDLVREGQVLTGATYVTARVPGPDARARRQALYLDALAATTAPDELLLVVEGSIEKRPMRCPKCRHNWHRSQEKRSDVLLALALVMGAADDTYDTAVLVTADADLIPAVHLVRDRFARKVLLITPPATKAEELAAACDAHLHLTKPRLGRCQLPPAVGVGGRTLEWPAEWT
jgi:uncharacterized LabA/DUF88 family protein